MKEDERLKIFGFVEGKTKCERCCGLLTKDTAWWAMGAWWHRLVKDCELIESGRNT